MPRETDDPNAFSTGFRETVSDPMKRIETMERLAKRGYTIKDDGTTVTLYRPDGSVAMTATRPPS